MTPPINARRALSVSNWRMMRPRPAPSVARRVISRSRVAERARTRFATLTQAIKRTRTTAPNSLTKTDDANTILLIDIRILSFQARDDRFHFRLRLGQSDTLAKATEDNHRMIFAV